MFYSMEEQASHITKLMEENRRYIRENGKLKKNRSRDTHVLDSEDYDNNYYGNRLTGLEDRIFSLQLENTELNLCLEKEKRKRREAEARLQREESYIKRLEDNVQTLRGTRVVMDPNTYRQVAEAYRAARRTPARRPHTHTGVPDSDLVCDSTIESPTAHTRLSHSMSLQTTSSSSWPSSPKSSSPSSSSTMLPSEDSQLYSSDDFSVPCTLGDQSSSRKGRRGGATGHREREGGMGVGGRTMNPWDYQQLLESLEDLDGASRGALS